MLVAEVCFRHTYKDERVPPPLLEHIIMDVILPVLLAHCFCTIEQFGSDSVAAVPRASSLAPPTRCKQAA